MHIIIIANHQPAALAPLADNGCAAMLPVGGKPVIEHLLENVATVQHSKMTIVASRGFNSLSQFIGSGARWGLDINLVSSRPNETLSSLKRREPEKFDSALLVLSADRVYTESLEQHSEIVSWVDSADPASDDVTQVTEPALTLADHKEYLELNLAAARGEIDQLRLRGRERALGLTTGYMTRIDPRSIRVGQTHAGNHCRVDKTAQLSGTVVLDSGVVIDRNTRLNDVVVLEHTYVGEQLNLERCIVSGRHLIRVDEGVVVELTDSFMTAPLQEGVYAAHLAGPANQLVGAVASIAALPFMGIALLMGLWQSPYEPLVKKQWVSNRSANPGKRYREFNGFEFNVSQRAARRLPQVFAVAMGHLRWFGVSMATSEELDARREPWQMTRDTCPSGVFGPAQLSCGDSATVEERFLSDAGYVPSAGWKTHVEILGDVVRNLFSRPDAAVQAPTQTG